MDVFLPQVFISRRRGGGGRGKDKQKIQLQTTCATIKKCNSLEASCPLCKRNV